MKLLKVQRYTPLFLLLALFSTENLLAQFEDEEYVQTATPPNDPTQKESFADKIFVGGGLGAQFGDITSIELSPVVGYKLTERFHTGVGFTYRYFEDTRFNYSTNIYGGNLFGRFLITENIFAHAEYEALYGEWEFDREPYIINSVFLGGGFMQQFGNSFATIMLLYNINDSAFNPYSNPILRLGFGVGFN